MRTINCTLLEAFVSDNLQYAADYDTVAEYILTNCEATGDYTPFLAEDATEEEVYEFTNYVNETYNYPACTKQYQYRFKATRIQDNKVIYTGSYKHSRELDELEKMSFLHEYTNRMLLKDLKFLNIEVYKL